MHGARGCDARRFPRWDSTSRICLENKLEGMHRVLKQLTSGFAPPNQGVSPQITQLQQEKGSGATLPCSSCRTRSLSTPTGGHTRARGSSEAAQKPPGAAPKPPPAALGPGEPGAGNPAQTRPAVPASGDDLMLFWNRKRLLGRWHLLLVWAEQSRLHFSFTLPASVA